MNRIHFEREREMELWLSKTLCAIFMYAFLSIADTYWFSQLLFGLSLSLSFVRRLASHSLDFLLSTHLTCFLLAQLESYRFSVKLARRAVCNFSLMHRSIFSTGVSMDDLYDGKIACVRYFFSVAVAVVVIVVLFVLFFDVSLSFYAINTTEITKVFIKFGIG